MTKHFFLYAGLGIVFVCAGMTGGATAARAQDGARLAAQLCSACHGVHGDSQSPMFPRLNAQTHEYLVAQLKGFRQHVRGETDARSYMWAIASQLDDVTVESLAEYFSHQVPMHGKPGNEALMMQGREIFERGVPERGTPACASCHGAQGRAQGSFQGLPGSTKRICCARSRCSETASEPMLR
jgi:cytochrome c553